MTYFFHPRYFSKGFDVKCIAMFLQNFVSAVLCSYVVASKRALEHKDLDCSDKGTYLKRNGLSLSSAT